MLYSVLLIFQKQKGQGECHLLLTFHQIKFHGYGLSVNLWKIVFTSAV